MNKKVKFENGSEINICESQCNIRGEGWFIGVDLAKVFMETDECLTCLFYKLCKAADLPHCDGSDYYKGLDIQ
jgi:hypothetical protein